MECLCTERWTRHGREGAASVSLDDFLLVVVRVDADHLRDKRAQIRPFEVVPHRALHPIRAGGVGGKHDVHDAGGQLGHGLRGAIVELLRRGGGLLELVVVTRIFPQAGQRAVGVLLLISPQDRFRRIATWSGVVRSKTELC